jgi:hypothetical protein
VNVDGAQKIPPKWLSVTGNDFYQHQVRGGLKEQGGCVRAGLQYIRYVQGGRSLAIPSDGVIRQQNRSPGKQGRMSETPVGRLIQEELKSGSDRFIVHPEHKRQCGKCELLFVPLSEHLIDARIKLDESPFTPTYEAGCFVRHRSCVKFAADGIRSCAAASRCCPR